MMTFEGAIGDRVGLRDLLDTYADAVNRADCAAWTATWVEDCLWTLPVLGTIKGRSAVSATWNDAMRGFPGLLFRAWPGSMQIDGDDAVMTSYTEEIHARDGMLHRDYGRYEDRCRKVGGVWLFAERRFQSLRRTAVREVMA